MHVGRYYGPYKMAIHVLYGIYMVRIWPIYMDHIYIYICRHVGHIHGVYICLICIYIYMYPLYVASIWSIYGPKTWAIYIAQVYMYIHMGQYIYIYIYMGIYRLYMEDMSHRRIICMHDLYTYIYSYMCVQET